MYCQSEVELVFMWRQSPSPAITGRRHLISNVLRPSLHFHVPTNQRPTTGHVKPLTPGRLGRVDPAGGRGAGGPRRALEGRRLQLVLADDEDVETAEITAVDDVVTVQKGCPICIVVVVAI